MMICSRLAPPAAILVLVACHGPAPSSAIDPALSARVPTASVALAGVDLDLLRGSPLYGKLPAATVAVLAPFDRARRVLLASSGSELLVIARGVVPGSTQIAPDVALSGAPGLISAATAPHPPAPILAVADAVARSSPVWAAIRGGTVLPLAGNWANLNNLLRGAEYVTFALKPGDPVEFNVVAQCPAPEEAQRCERSIRAAISLAIAAHPRQPGTTAVLQDVRIVREERVVRLSLSVPADVLAGLVF
jgi:hypothetical protein